MQGPVAYAHSLPLPLAFQESVEINEVILGGLSSKAGAVLRVGSKLRF